MGKAVKYIKMLTTYMGASLIPMLLNLLVNPLIALNMSPEDYAVTGYFTSFNALINPIITFYLLHYYVKSYFNLDEEGRLKLRATIFKALIFFSFGVAALCLLLLAGYMLLIDTDLQFPVFPYLLMSVFALPLAGIYTLELTDFKMMKKSSAYFRLSVTSGVTLVVMNLLMVVLLKWGAIGRLLSPLIINLLFFIFLIIRHRNYFKIPFDTAAFKDILRFCLPLAASAALGYFFNGFDRTCLESLGQVHEYGIYVVGAQMAAYLTTFSAAVNSTFQPDMYKAIAEKDRKAFASSVGLIVGSVSVVVLLFILFAPLLIRILTAGRYVDSTPYARILALSTITSSIYYVINNYTVAKGWPKLYLYTTVAGSIVMAIAMPRATAVWGFTGAAVTVVLSYIVLSLFNLFFIRIRHWLTFCKKTHPE